MHHVALDVRSLSADGPLAVWALRAVKFQTQVRVWMSRPTWQHISGIYIYTQPTQKSKVNIQQSVKLLILRFFCIQ